MDFPLTYLVQKVVDKKNKVMTKHLARQEVSLLEFIYGLLTIGIGIEVRNKELEAK